MMRDGWFWLLVNLVGLLSSLAVLTTAVMLDPDPRGFGTHEQLGLYPCGTLAITGKPCATCGMTTCFANMAEAKFSAAWSANPGGVPLFLMTLIMPLWFGHSLWTGKDPFRFTSKPATKWVALGIVLLIIVCFLSRQA